MHRKHQVFTTLLAALMLTLLLVTTVRAQDDGLPPVELAGVSDIPQRLSASGYPQLGDPDAPLHIVEYCSLGTPSCATYWLEQFPPLVERIADGTIRYTQIPLTGPEASAVRTATRAALCAGEQGRYWALTTALHTALQASPDQPDAALAAESLLAQIDALPGLDRAAWDACMLTDRPDATLTRARAERNAEASFTGAVLPFIRVNDQPVLPDYTNLSAVIAAFETTTAEATPDPAATEDAPLVFEPLLGEAIEPPLTIDLPPGWRFGYDAILMNDLDGLPRSVPLAIYTGPVNEGAARATIVLLWGFPNLVVGNPFASDEVATDLWSDGLRLLRLVVIEQGCNIGTDLRRSYTVGGLSAAGTQFAAVDCPDLPDTRGWFAGLREGNINFVFYVYTEPIDAMDSAEAELQAILDSVVFQVP